jgi:hypothetical protein
MRRLILAFAIVTLFVLPSFWGKVDAIDKWRTPSGGLYFGDSPPPGSQKVGEVGFDGGGQVSRRYDPFTRTTKLSIEPFTLEHSEFRDITIGAWSVVSDNTAGVPPPSVVLRIDLTNRLGNEAAPAIHEMNTDVVYVLIDDSPVQLQDIDYVGDWVGSDAVEFLQVGVPTQIFAKMTAARRVDVRVTTLVQFSLGRSELAQFSALLSQLVGMSSRPAVPTESERAELRSRQAEKERRDTDAREEFKMAMAERERAESERPSANKRLTSSNINDNCQTEPRPNLNKPHVTRSDPSRTRRAGGTGPVHAATCFVRESA